jgi:hypothetical protein
LVVKMMDGCHARQLRQLSTTRFLMSIFVHNIVSYPDISLLLSLFRFYV